MKTIIPNFIKAPLRQLRRAWQRRYYYLAGLFNVDVPIHSISWVPDGFAVSRIGSTSLRLVENFCTAEEASRLTEGALTRLGCQPNSVLMNDLHETTICAISAKNKEHDPDVLALMFRCAVLFGVPYTHCSRVIFANSTAGMTPDLLSSQRPPDAAGECHAITIYLNDVAGETLFEQLRLAIKPALGRAVCWSSATPGEQLPTEIAPAEGQCKFLLQFWFVRQPVFSPVHDEQAFLQARKGEPLSGQETTPDGVWAPQDLDLEAVFGRPDKMKGLV